MSIPWAPERHKHVRGTKQQLPIWGRGWGRGGSWSPRAVGRSPCLGTTWQLGDLPTGPGPAGDIQSCTQVRPWAPGHRRQVYTEHPGQIPVHFRVPLCGPLGSTSRDQCHFLRAQDTCTRQVPCLGKHQQCAQGQPGVPGTSVSKLTSPYGQTPVLWTDTGPMDGHLLWWPRLNN